MSSASEAMRLVPHQNDMDQIADGVGATAENHVSILEQIFGTEKANSLKVAALFRES